MTTTQENPTTQAVELITVVIDGFEVSVPKGTLVIRAAEKLGIQIPLRCLTSFSNELLVKRICIRPSN